MITFDGRRQYSWCGTGPNGCIVLSGYSAAGPARGVLWRPGSSGRTLRFKTDTACSSGCCGQIYGPNEGGCVGVPGNVAQFGINSFSIL